MTPTFREVLAMARTHGNPQALVQAVPYARFMGISMDLVAGDIVGQMNYDDDLIGNYRLPALHGGTLGALLESTAIFKLLWQEEILTVPRTINITVQYLRSAKPVGTSARAVITRQGRRIANVTVLAWQESEDTPVASAVGNFLL